jgi:hypothetical protein
MGACLVSDDLPPGFVPGAPSDASSDLPPGFVSGVPHKFGLGDTWPARLAKSVYSAVTLPGDVMSGAQTMPGLGDRPQSGPAPTAPNENSTFIGRALNIPPAAANPMDELSGRVLDLATLGTPMAPKAATGLVAPKVGLPTAEELKSAASTGYDSARNMGVDIKPEAISGTAQTLAQTLEKDGINAKLAPKTFGIIDELAAPPAGSVATIANLETARRSLGHAAQDFLNPTEKMAASRAIQHLDDYLGNIPQADVLAGDAAQASKILSEARQNYAASKRSSQINGEVDIAEGNAAAANSGQNIGNSVRQRFNSILKSDKKSSGYTDAEIAQMEKVRNGTALGNAARVGGNLLGGGGGLGSVASAAVGAGSLGPIGATAPALGYALKKLSDASVARQVRKLDEMTRSRAPLAQGTASTGLTAAEQFKRELLLRSLLATRPR